MLITIERRASCSMFARSCKHPISIPSKFIVDLVTTTLQFCKAYSRAVTQVRVLHSVNEED